MRRRRHLGALFTSAGCALQLACPVGLAAEVGTHRQESRRPNIVFILADDLGYGDLGCFGCPDTKTPHLDRLAEQGARLTAHYANGPSCTPTRAAFLTGRYQQRVGGLECAIGIGNVGRYDDAIRLRRTDDLGLPADEQTISRLLQSSGYATALFGKWHLGYGPKFSPANHGFDESFYCAGGEIDYFHYSEKTRSPTVPNGLLHNGNPVQADGYFTDLVTDKAVEFLRSRDEDRPFFLYLPYTTPHSPYQGPGDRRPDPLPAESPLWKQSHAPHDTYIAMVEKMDSCVGRLVSALREEGVNNDTLIVFASDNGGTRSARNAPFSGYKGSTYEGGIRVPAIVCWPGHVPPGTVSGQVCATFDFSASFARLARASALTSESFDGVDIVGHIISGAGDFTRTLFWRKQRGAAVWTGVRDADLKYVAKRGEGRVKEFLYDLDADPSELRDIKNERPGDLSRIRSLYENWELAVRKDRRGQATGARE